MRLRLTTRQSEFVDYLVSLWDPTPSAAIPSAADTPRRTISYTSASFCHEYCITTHRAWQTWKAGSVTGTVYQQPALDDRRRYLWWCGSLKEAARHYSWTTSKAGSFSTLASRLQMAIKSGCKATTKKVCLDIFEWGGVARKSNNASRVWLDAAGAANLLVPQLKQAVGVLQPSMTVGLAMFRRDGLLMNSAMTKVYAAADPQHIVIYDGRVGAALCLFVREFLRPTLLTSVPDDLAFLWGAAQGRDASKRDPSSARFSFKSLNHYGVGDRKRAETARRTNSILTAMVNRLRAKHVAVTLAGVEQALFMVGYDVRAMKATTIPRGRNPGNR